MLTTRNFDNFLLTIIAPVYNEQEGIRAFYERLSAALQAHKYNYELVFVNDGSKDDSLLLLLQMAEADKRVKVLNFSRNFGHQVAVSAGMDYAAGDAVVIIDTDLQDPPELIAELVKKWGEGYDVVNALRKSRKDSFFKEFTAELFYKFLNKILTSKIPENVGDFRLMDRRAVNILKKIKEKDRYIRGLTTWIGFEQTFVEFDRDKRFAGETHYPLSKMIDLALNAIYSFSSVPMKLANLASLVFFTFSIMVMTYVALVYAFGSKAPGWTSELIIILFSGSIQMFILGIISEYVGRIYKEVRERPLYIVADEINFSKTPNESSGRN